MHKLLIFVHLILGLLSLKLNAQYNLVPNSSFEIYSSCPTTSGQIMFATPWQIPNNGTPDYFHRCSSTFGVPSYCNCSSVYQQPNLGDAYVGIWCWNYITDTREYIQIQLLDTLTINDCYVISFYTNLVNWAKIACNNIGVYLSDTAINSTSLLMEYPTQIKNFNNEIITDTLDWHRIEGIYVANGSELFLTIGNFNNDLTTDTLTVNFSNSNAAYYFIDDVSVISIDSIPGGMPAYAGADTNVIVGDSVFIGQKISNLNCNWYNAIGSLIASGTSGIYVNPTASTFYVVEQNLCGVITYDTVNVTVLPTSVYELQNENNIRLYPNPNNGSFTIIHNLEGKNYVLEIIDLMGKIVHSENITAAQQEISTQQLSKGLYLVNLKTNTDKLVHITKMSIVR
ncbi:MAG: T9SS type A sorting domain-containing protein [Flavobacteriales bacterium]|nr:T9SS type A sorting domain-containing protein [Flavobacteriales bacterium]